MITDGVSYDTSFPQFMIGTTMKLNEIESPFAQLRTLLGTSQPGGDPIDMTIGAPRHPMPDFVADVLQKHNHEFMKYPPIVGHPALRAALEQWHWRRYPTLRGVVTAEEHILPLNGSREGLFSALFIALERKKFTQKPAVLIPNPFYQCYAAASVAAGCESVYLPCYEEMGYLPDLDALSPDLLKRTAVFYLCSPSNPQGAVADKAYLEKVIALARQYNFMVFSDECYSEIYSDMPPVGALEVALEMEQGVGGDPFANVLTFNSLSKRSNVPGLRSGFCAGDQNFISDYSAFRNVAGPQIPLPIQMVSAKIWSDESHVIKNRKLYQLKFDLADNILSNCFNYKKPDGGFFLWLNFSKLGGGVETASTLWKGFGVKILPGAFLAQNVAGEKNPGEDYGRIAMVHDIEVTEKALNHITMLI